MLFRSVERAAVRPARTKKISGLARSREIVGTFAIELPDRGFTLSFRHNNTTKYNQSWVTILGTSELPLAVSDRAPVTAEAHVEA